MKSTVGWVQCPVFCFARDDRPNYNFISQPADHLNQYIPNLFAWFEHSVTTALVLNSKQVKKGRVVGSFHFDGGYGIRSGCNY